MRTKKLFTIFLTVLVFLTAVQSFFASAVSAEDHPNNKFGIHLAVPDSGQIEKAAALVNANGGDWGYITLIIQENDRDKNKWQDIFNKLRELHLIPIIRIATQPEGPVWRRPNKEDADGWAEFLNSLNWVVKDRYVILFNETNHGQEWGGSVDPAGYAEVSKVFAEKLKAKNSDFVVMLGGFDASAPAAAPDYADEGQYLKTVIDTIGRDNFNTLFSGWSSHSYPNPGFVGSPYGGGRGTVKTYEWELELLRSWGIKDLPVFITETGWEGNSLSRSTIANNFLIAYTNVWLPDDRVKAVTPFVLDYQAPPFLGFSWKQYGNDDYYPEYYAVQSMEKTAGEPEIHETGSIDYSLPQTFVVNSSYNYTITIKNNGQGIWSRKNGYVLVLENFDSGFYFADMGTVKPFQNAKVQFFIKTAKDPGKKNVTISLYKGSKKILSSKPWNIELIPLPSLNFNVSLYPKLKHNGNDFEVQVFDSNEQLVFKKKNVSVEHTEGVVKDIKNITLNRKYRVVILKPYYLPRQTYVNFKREKNEAVFERMWPIDFNRDGKFSLIDIWTLLTHPSLFKLLLP
jgi:hypothetical protein